MYFCYSAAGGTGTSVFAAALALHLATRSSTLLVDLCGDQGLILGVGGEDAAGVADWLSAADDVTVDALRRLEVEANSTLSLLPRGSGPFADATRSSALVDALQSSSRPVVVDAGTLDSPVAIAIAAAADQRLLVTKACYIALRRAGSRPIDPTGVIVQREPGRALGRQLVQASIDAPIIASIGYDPAVFRAVDAGLLAHRSPRSLRRAARKVVA